MSYLKNLKKSKKIFIYISILTILVLPQAQAAVIFGNPNGSVVLSFIYDYQCPHCHRMFPLVQELMSDNSDLKVALYPVAVINETSIFEAAFAIASATQPKKFQALTEYLMEHKPLQGQDLQEVIHKFGLDNPSFVELAHSQWVKMQLMQGLELMRSVNAQSVPVFVINNNKVLIGEQSYRTLKKAIKDARHT